MASRRTRIKGIANIPQRRKNVASEEKDNEINNLKNEQDTVKEVSNEALPEVENEIEEVSTVQSIGEPNCVPTEVVLNDPSIFGNDENPDETLKPVVKESPTKTIEPQIVVPQASQKPNPAIKRRTFIKPAVSSSVINRKPKQNVEKEISETKIEAAPSKASTPSQTFQLDATADNVKEKSEGNLGQEVTLDEVHLTSQSVPEQEVFTDNGVKKVLPHTSHAVVSDSEYPPPPPSPSKINRSRIKAIPRLGYRKTSFSASESEDESKRNYNRHRNDSVCSTASGAFESISDCLSPQRPKDPGPIMLKKCNRTEQSRKLAEARREFQRRFGTTKPDRQRLTMIDLIFYNPTSNPMTNDGKSKPENEEVQDVETSTADVESEKADDPEPEKLDDTGKSDEENEIPAPQVKIGPSGELILDEKSLVIERKEVQKQREELQKTKLVDGDFDTGYGVYKRHKRAKEWTPNETLRFYKAVNTIGTDFTLMCELFPRRTRRELKQKFKKEEKINRSLIDKAVMQPCSFNYTELKHEVDMEEREMEELRKQKEAEVKLRQEKMEERQSKKRKAIEKAETEQNAEKPLPKPPTLSALPKPPKIRKIRKPRLKRHSLESMLEDSDADVSDIASQSESEGEEEIVAPLKPTRSGRIPKITKKFDTTEEYSIENIMKRNKVTKSDISNVEPGSIMIISEKGPSGEPVHKIYMVTADNNATPLNLNSETVSKAIQFKQGVMAQNILTISASVTDDEGETVSEENNVTIPADANVTSLRGNVGVCNGNGSTEVSDAAAEENLAA